MQTPSNGLAGARRLQSLNGKIRNEARRRGVAADDVRKQYIFAVFFKRLFKDPDSTWMLLGGNALLVRTGRGRFTQDIDLSRSPEWEDLGDVVQEIEQLVLGDNDGFSFRVTRVEARSEPDTYGYGTKTAKLHVAAYLYLQEFDQFSIDITSRRHAGGGVSIHQLVPVIDDEALRDLPAIPIVPAENHLADKICALYEIHGQTQTPSTRYRDLADAVRIVADTTLNAEVFKATLRHEEKRRRVSLPKELRAPADSWEEAFPRAAKTFAEYPQDLAPLEKALAFVGNCVNPILASSKTDRTWDPAKQSWSA